MRLIGRRIPKGNLLVLISFTAISLCLVMIISLTRAEKFNSVIKKGLYTDNRDSFYIYNAVSGDQWYDVIPELEERFDNFTIYEEISDPETTVRGVYIKGKVVVPPLIWGKYFDKNTSWTDNPKIVIGKAFEDRTFELKGKKYYKYCNTDCEVIGIMGTQIESRLDYMILVDMKTALMVSDVNTNYVVDSSNKDIMHGIKAYISQAFSYPTEVEITLTEGERYVYTIAKLFSSDSITNTLYIMMLVCFSVSTGLVTIIWLRNRRTLIYACNLCGFKLINKVMYLSKRYYIIAGCGFVFGLVLCGIFSLFENEISMGVIDVICAFMATLGIGAIILGICFFKFRKGFL